MGITTAQGESQGFEQLFERKRKRRESHNVVERRRREFINERIDELYTLMDGSAENKPSRGHILKLTVDYLRDLQAQSIKQQYRLQELEARLASPNH
ncbi:hypothetical protein BC940DRAFT_308247 [Gongronella butleri]|nr:hypothetical protein BC940DRAFT_308247 [Gongronella butleri]